MTWLCQWTSFPTAIKFLLDQAVPSVIAVPYCTAPPKEEVLVFEWCSQESHTLDATWKRDRIGREDAARRKGIERCGWHRHWCVIYDMAGCQEDETTLVFLPVQRGCHRRH